MTDETVAMDRATRVGEMEKSLAIGCAIWDMLKEKEILLEDAEYVSVLFGIDDVRKAVALHFKTPVHKDRLKLITHGLFGVLHDHEGTTSCALWDLCHLIDHALYDDLKDLP